MTAGDGGGGDGAGDSVGLLQAVAIEVGLIVGAGLFSLTGVATTLAGTAVPLSYVFTFTVVAMSLVPTAALAAARPVTGGNYWYPSRLWSPRVAFLTAWGLSISMFGGGLPVYALSFGRYVDSLVAVDPVGVGVVVLTAFYLVNLAGIDVAASVQLLLFATLVASLVVFIVVGAPAVEPANFEPFLSTGVTGLLTGAGVLYFVCLGANFIVDLGEDVQAATVTIPRSLAVSIPLVFVLYVGTALVAVGTVGAAGPGSMDGATLSVPAQVALPPALATFFVVGGALFAIATSINAVFIIAPKYMVVLADDGFFPAVLADTNARFDTPHWGLTLVFLLSLASLLSPLPVADLGSLLGFGGIVLIVPMMVAAVRFVRRHPDRYAATPLPVPARVTVALAVAAVCANAVLLVLLASQSPLLFGAWAGLTVGAGGAYYLVRRRYLAGRGIGLLEGFDEEF
ncbi:APC family permease [Haloarchaeobius amylolyticus]|uniref:APC family permease n=1 Tax=Haloarchaeobius amylolyticus TaxID=1198296 RepID=UPI00227203BB|nr:APC family permease [Haloarchaeobius amylolyticus]